MKWIYGKQDFKTKDRGMENCYLLTNGLGGFSSLTMTGAAARNDHAVMMACIKAPNHRYNIIHRLRERLILDGQTLTLSTQEFADGSCEDGYEYLSCFTFEDTPVWRMLAEGVEIVKEIAMVQDENTVAVKYEIINTGKKSCCLEIVPFFQFVKKGADLDKTQTFEMNHTEEGAATFGTVCSKDLRLYYRTNGHVSPISETETYFYSYDVCDGRRETGCAKAVQMITVNVPAGGHQVLELVYAMEHEMDQIPEADAVIENAKIYRKALLEQSGFKHPAAGMLAKSANQFISRRVSTGGDTILAGYPFFEDWGRDTMIALPGVCICTGQFDRAREILRTFAVNEKKGLMPNLFPEGGNEPLYNTVDAALLFINCIYLYYKATADKGFVKEVYPVMERIIDGYKNGTDFDIHMDTDGLIAAGSGLAQVTWMDVRVGEILPTPRHGKPVEINAYWYNALKVMSLMAELTGNEGSEYETLAQKVKVSFNEKFPVPHKGYLKDVLSGTKADLQIRCNQIWAVSMPFTMLPPDMERQVVDTVFEKLYTPYGLRTLAMDDEQFHSVYTGPMEDRDMAYHQGTVWTFPLGGYYLAYLKVHGYSEAAKRRVWGQLEVMESALREGCIGQLPEIYDGKNPTSSKGCFAQAWSVGEMLRVYAALERS